VPEAHNIERLLEIVRELYRLHGIKALATPFLEKQRPALYPRLLAAGLMQPELLARLGLADQYAAWKNATFKYRGKTKPKWTWDRAVQVARELKQREGELPNVEWCRLNGYSSLTSHVHLWGKTWDDLRTVVGDFGSSTFCASRNGIRWRSRPEASLSNFLYARGIEHKRGERYADGYAEQSGRLYGRYDLHFLSKAATWIDVEVWGDPLNQLNGGRYEVTRALKEAWHVGNSAFLGIAYRDCLSDDRLTKILEPYIGTIDPFQFDEPRDHFIETAHWSDADDLLATCAEFAARMPDGIFPSEDWLRKRGKYANRPGEPYNTVAVRVNQWLGGTRSVRRLLGHAHASTTEWSAEAAIDAWRAFEKAHGMTPSQCVGVKRLASVTVSVAREAGRIYEAARKLGVLNEARQGRHARKITWTPEHAVAEWARFCNEHGRAPSECLSAKQRRSLPRAVTIEATRIYDAVRRLGLLTLARQERD
jgi:hypothetical protein